MNYLKSISRLALIVLFGLTFMTSCKKDKLEDLAPGNEITENGSYFNLERANGTENDSTECFTINYPVDVLFPDGAVQPVNNETELETVIDAWFDQNGENTEDYPTLSFPITVTLEDGTSQTINDEEQLCDLFFECYGEFEDWEEGDWDDEDWEEDCEDIDELCFELQYPITLSGDGVILTVDSDEELETLIGADEEDYDFVYPINITLEDGTSQTINDENELDEAIETCFGEYDYEDDCFELNFPVTLVLPDGTTVTGNNEEELEAGVDPWYDNNPQNEDEPTFQYPISVTLDDSTTQTIQDEAALEALIDQCE